MLEFVHDLEEVERQLLVEKDEEKLEKLREIVLEEEHRNEVMEQEYQEKIEMYDELERERISKLNLENDFYGLEQPVILSLENEIEQQ